MSRDRRASGTYGSHFPADCAIAIDLSLRVVCMDAPYRQIAVEIPEQSLVGKTRMPAELSGGVAITELRYKLFIAGGLDHIAGYLLLDVAQEEFDWALEGLDSLTLAPHVRTGTISPRHPIIAVGHHNAF